MTVTDVTNTWIRELDSFAVFQGGALSPATARPLPLRDRPALPDPQEWSSMSRLLEQMREHVLRFAADSAVQLPRKSLFRGESPNDRYRLEAGQTEVLGKLYLLDGGSSAPFTPNLQRFVAFVPATYSRNGDSGHYAWVHYTPVWGGDRAAAPRARDITQAYPGGLWTHFYIADYLLRHRLLAAYAAARVNAVLFLPVHRFTAGDALSPLAQPASLLAILRQLCAGLERIDRRLRAHQGDRAGSIEAYGVSCFSFGAQYSSGPFTRSGVAVDDYGRLRAGVFLDGVASEPVRVCRDIFGEGDGERGWLAMPVPGTQAPRRLAMYQQSNLSGRDFVSAAATIFRTGPPGPGTTLRRTPAWRRNHGYFHRVDNQQLVCVAQEGRCGDRSLDYEYCHGRIHALFMEEGFTFSRDSFLW